MTAASIVANALAYLHAYARDECVPAFVCSSQLFNVIAPRLGAAMRIHAGISLLVMRAPTAWCALELRLVDPTPTVLKRIRRCFVQLRRIVVDREDRDCGGLHELLPRINARSTVRDVELGSGVRVGDAMLEALGAIVETCQSLVLRNCTRVTDAGLSSVRGMKRLRELSLSSVRLISDDALAAVLADASLLRSLSLEDTSLTGGFLGNVPSTYADHLQQLSIDRSDEFRNAGAAHVSTFRGLTALQVSECSLVSMLDLTRLHNLTSVGAVGHRGYRREAFLSRCTTLTTVDLSALTNVTKLGSGFMSDCKHLTTVQLRGLDSVTEVGYDFLSHCERLTSLDLRGLENLATVGTHFLSKCERLRSLDLASLCGLKVIGDSFLSCVSPHLTALDFTALTQVTSVGDNFLWPRLPSLTRIRLSQALLSTVEAQELALHTDDGW